MMVNERTKKILSKLINKITIILRMLAIIEIVFLICDRKDLILKIVKNCVDV